MREAKRRRRQADLHHRERLHAQFGTSGRVGRVKVTTTEPAPQQRSAAAPTLSPAVSSVQRTTASTGTTASTTKRASGAGAGWLAGGGLYVVGNTVVDALGAPEGGYAIVGVFSIGLGVTVAGIVRQHRERTAESESTAESE